MISASQVSILVLFIVPSLDIDQRSLYRVKGPSLDDICSSQNPNKLRVSSLDALVLNILLAVVFDVFLSILFEVFSLDY